MKMEVIIKHQAIVTEIVKVTMILKKVSVTKSQVVH